MVAPRKNSIPSPSVRRVAIYARRSEEAGHRDRSIEEQVKDGRAWVRSRSLVPYEPDYVELGSGVTAIDRPVFLKMIEDAGKGRFDDVLVLDLSRFGRTDLAETGYYLHTLRLAGCRLLSILDGDQATGEIDENQLAMKASANRDQSRKNGYKVALAHYACIERGVLPGGRRPYGYQLVRRADWEKAQRKDTRLEIDESEAKIVRRMFSEYEGGASPTTIAGWLNAEGVASPGGGRWWRTAVTEILANPVYCGDLVRNGRRRGNTCPKKQAHFYRLGPRPVPAAQEPEPVVRRDVFPALVARDLWDRVQARLDARAITPIGGKPHVLSGLLRCGACSGPMKSVSGRTTQKGRVRYYGCTRAKMHGPAATRGDCGRVNVRGDRLEAEVLRLVRDAASNVDAATIATELKAALPSVAPVDTKKLEQRLRQIEQRRDALLLSDHATDFVAGGLKKLEAEHASVKAQIEAASAASTQAVDLDRAVAAAIDAARNLDAPNTDEGREALREALAVFLARVEVAPGERGAPRAVRVDVYTPKAVAVTATRQDLWGLTHPRK